MVQSLMEGATSQDVVESTGLNISTVRRYINIMRRHGIVYVESWIPDKRNRECSAIYRLGRKRDTPRNVMTPAEKQRNYRAKKKQISEMHALCGKI